MNNDEKILKALADLQADVTAVKGEVQKIPAIEKQLEQQGKDIAALKSGQAQQGKQLDHQGKLLSGIAATMGTVLEEQQAQRRDIRSLLTDMSTLHEETHVSHEELKAEIKAARAEAKMDNIDLKAAVLKKNQSYERRITNLEEQAGIENPEKH